jgi:hypothetical protein
MECYNCGRKEHVSRNCKAPVINNNGTNNGSQSTSRLN